jgi:hypothetical protein
MSHEARQSAKGIILRHCCPLPAPKFGGRSDGFRTVRLL